MGGKLNDNHTNVFRILYFCTLPNYQNWEIQNMIPPNLDKLEKRFSRTFYLDVPTIRWLFARIKELEAELVEVRKHYAESIEARTK